MLESIYRENVTLYFISLHHISVDPEAWLAVSTESKLEIDPFLRWKNILLQKVDLYLLWSDDVPCSEVLQGLIQDVAPCEPLSPAVGRQ